ncbi:MAG: hypothetical protein DRJ09_06675 [Bacteroidetes bacterium]|nr:MAG: hypothetical protein DRJ09_06675 [Bacteroidota bacterium]
MDIQIQKLSIIHRLIQINDKSVINKIDSLLSTISNEPMSLEEFYARIDEAEEDVSKGDVITHSDLLKKIETW